MNAVEDAPGSSGSSGSSGDARPGKARARALGALAALFLLTAFGFGLYCFFIWRFEESTDNAYVAGNLVRVSSQVSGDVAALLADNNDLVRAGQVLVRLEDADATLAFERARSDLADAVRQTRSLMAESDRLASLVALRTKELEKAQGDYERRRERKTAMAVSEEELSHARDNLAIAQLALQVAEHDRQRTMMLLQNKPLEEQPSVRRAAHVMREAWLALKRCEIKSPVSGYVAKRSVQLGTHVTPGMPLMAVVPLDEVWVDANFKEVQLGRMRIGQKAEVRADMYGGAVRYEGEVSGFSAGTGSSFSLLPPENATGNWIKVVQRVPVKIALKAEDLARHPLLVGLSCLVTVDVRDAGGLLLIDAPRPGDEPVFATGALSHELADVDREIEAIIRANAAVGE